MATSETLRNSGNRPQAPVLPISGTPRRTLIGPETAYSALMMAGDVLTILVARLTSRASQVAAELPEHSASLDPPSLSTPGWVRPLLFCYRGQWALRSRLGRPLGPAAPAPGVSDPATTSGSRADGDAPISAAGSVTRRESDSRRAGRTRP